MKERRKVERKECILKEGGREGGRRKGGRKEGTLKEGRKGGRKERGKGRKEEGRKLTFGRRSAQRGGPVVAGFVLVATTQQQNGHHVSVLVLGCHEQGSSAIVVRFVLSGKCQHTTFSRSGHSAQHQNSQPVGIFSQLEIFQYKIGSQY
jgi:hypothetical protein